MALAVPTSALLLSRAIREPHAGATPTPHTHAQCETTLHLLYDFLQQPTATGHCVHDPELPTSPGTSQIHAWGFMRGAAWLCSATLLQDGSPGGRLPTDAHPGASLTTTNSGAASLHRNPPTGMPALWCGRLLEETEELNRRHLERPERSGRSVLPPGSAHLCSVPSILPKSLPS